VISQKGFKGIENQKKGKKKDNFYVYAASRRQAITISMT
jgi:hypothetical protein